MGLNSLTFNGINSLTYGVYISGSGVFNAPARDRDVVEVPGRNGDIIRDRGRYKNIEVTYPAFIIKNFANNIRTWSNYLLKPTDYVRLEDTYHPDEFRLAVLADDMEVDPVAWLAAGSFDLRFNCRPERFLKSGENRWDIAQAGVVYNPTIMPSKPMLRVYGYGTITVNGTTITILAHSLQYIDIDCDLQEAYYGSTNANQYISCTEFPVIDPGTNQVSTNFINTGMQKLEIIPRTWQL